MDFDNATLTMIDPDTGKTVELGSPKAIAWNHVSFEENTAKAPVNVCNAYKFECKFEGLELNPGVKELFMQGQSWKDACRLTDILNDLIEEYHAPGTPRRERRAIKREFDKVFKIFCKHCQTYKIDFKFERPNN